jgi:hypothetical protein
VVLLAPSLLLGTLISQSSPQNLTWAAQFAEQFRAGILYPRWMPESFDGLGGPAFYFYPPLPFWIDGLVDVVSFGLLPVVHRLPLTWALLLWASGLAMYAWLESETTNRRISFWGALAYMAAPYHLYDHYTRGALAEFTAFVFLPIILLSLRRPVWLALSYAGLLLSHLPTAMLVTITIVVPFALLRLRRWPALLSAGAAGLLGIGLAAIYLVPALALQPWISSDQLWSAFYDARRWLLLAPSRWPETYTMQVVVPLSLAYGIACLSVLMFFRARAAAVFFAVVALVCLGLMAGIVPWFWDVPLFAKVQFPWRLLVAVEFAVVTALSLASVDRLRRPGLLLLAAAGLIMIPAARVIVQDTGARIAYALTGEPLSRQDAKEYEPRGFPLGTSPQYAQLGLEPLAGTPLISCAPTPHLCRAEAGRFGTLLVEIEGGAPTDVVLRRFFFPAWRLDPTVPLKPSVPYRLLSFTSPPGHHTYRLERATLPEEQWGWAISGVSLILLVASAALTSGARPCNPSA